MLECVNISDAIEGLSRPARGRRLRLFVAPMVRDYIVEGLQGRRVWVMSSEIARYHGLPADTGLASGVIGLWLQTHLGKTVGGVRVIAMRAVKHTRSGRRRFHYLVEVTGDE